MLTRKAALLISILAMCFLVSQEAHSQYFNNKPIEEKKNNSRHSISLNIGLFKEWKIPLNSQFYTPNDGFSISARHNLRLTDKWNINSALGIDKSNEYDLKRVYVNKNMQFDFSRRIILFKKSALSIFTGIAFLDEVTYVTSYSELSNGQIIATIFDIEKYNTPYHSFGIEFTTKTQKSINLGARFQGYYDYVGFGRSSISALINYTFSHKKH